jgi:hypothetical protein
MEPTSFPLRWPDSWPRTAGNARRVARFSKNKQAISVASAIARLYLELRRLRVKNIDDVIVSTNVRPTLHGQPSSRDGNPADPGVAVYFTLNNMARVLACDTWTRLADNIAAVAAHIGAMRQIDRYGVGTLDQLFEGFRALPAKGGTWRSMLGFEHDSHPTRAEIEAAFVIKAAIMHPDKAGGSHEAMAALNAARDAAKKEVAP